MSTTVETYPDRVGAPKTVDERPGRKLLRDPDQTFELGASAIAAFSAIWLAFELGGLNPFDAPFGFLVSLGLTWLLIYWVVTVTRHGVVESKDRLATLIVWMAGGAGLVGVFALVLVVVKNGAPVVFAHFPHFLDGELQRYAPTAPVTDAGVGPAIIGTLEQVGIAGLIAAPVAILTAIYLHETRGPMARVVGAVVDGMNSLPTIIAGLFVFLFWVVPRHTNGWSGFAGAMALAILMIPVVTLGAGEALRVVPNSLREASYALGAPVWRTTLRVVLPTALAGIVSATLLGLARAAGETAPVLFTAFGSEALNVNPFHNPQADLALTIYSNAFTASPNLRRVMWGASFVLIVLVLALFTVARLLSERRPGHRSLLTRMLRWRVASPSTSAGET